MGFASTAPLGNSIIGSSTPSPAAATSSRPSGESASEKVCGSAHACNASRISYARPDHESPTMWTVYGAARFASAQSRSMLEIVWWNISSGDAAGRTT